MYLSPVNDRLLAQPGPFLEEAVAAEHWGETVVYMDGAWVVRKMSVQGIERDMPRAPLVDRSWCEEVLNPTMGRLHRSQHACACQRDAEEYGRRLE